MLKHKLVFSAALLGMSYASFAQLSNNITGSDANVLTTTVPFLNITPDARAGGMGDAGVATPTDANSMHWNAAKLAFNTQDVSVSLNHTPWLRNILNDVSLSYVGVVGKINEVSGFGFSMRYFSLGDIVFTNEAMQTIKTFRPYELAIDGGYGLKLNSKLSLGIAARYILSDLAGQVSSGNGTSTRAARTFAGDLSLYHNSKVKYGSKDAELAFGVNISNLGGKISYTEAIAERDFIPANLKIGAFTNIHSDQYNEFGFALDFNKLLVPTTPVYERNAAGQLERDANGNPKVKEGMDPNVPTIQGAIQSFYDAPGGLKEELREFNPSVAMEYWYDRVAAVRLGYFYEHPTKGNRQYLTTGFGIRYQTIQVDLSYLVPTNTTRSLNRSPLANTFRFALTFNFGDNATAKSSEPASADPSSDAGSN